MYFILDRTFKKRQAEHLAEEILRQKQQPVWAMPAGVSLSQYVKFSVAAFLTMMAGSQSVHYYYKPLDGLEKMVQEETERMSKETQARNQYQL